MIDVALFSKWLEDASWSVLHNLHVWNSVQASGSQGYTWAADWVTTENNLGLASSISPKTMYEAGQIVG